MKADFKNIIEIYDNSNEIEKLIFKDVINDLIKWIFKLQKAKKIPQSIYIEKIAKDTIKDMNFQSTKEYNKFITDLRELIYKWIDIKNKVSWVFNITKPRSLIPKNIKEYYHTIWDEEIEIIQNYRKLLLKNLEEYWFIEIFVSKNKQYQEICKEFMESISKIDENNKIIYLWLSNIKDKNTRNHLARLEVDFWVDRIKKAFKYLFNDIELENYLCKEKDLELLKHRLNFKENTSNFDNYNWILYYSKKEIHKFKKEKDKNKQFELCKIIFNFSVWIKIDFSKLEKIYKQENNDDYYDDKISNNTNKIKKLIDKINIILKNWTENKKLLLLSQETIDNNHYVIRNF